MNLKLYQKIPTHNIKESLENWLIQQASDYQLSYLLAHGDDGVIWGKFKIKDSKNNNDLILKTSENPQLRLSTLQQCRIFGETGEILLWNSNDKWNARLISQTKVSQLLQDRQIGLIPENQILWGTQGKINGDFTLLSDGTQGLRHSVPIIVEENYFSQNKKELYRPVRLKVNHYFNYDNDGLARIFTSRLVSLIKVAKNAPKTFK
jgi:CRISPR-associated protein (TIGR03984 family)